MSFSKRQGSRRVQFAGRPWNDAAIDLQQLLDEVIQAADDPVNAGAPTSPTGSAAAEGSADTLLRSDATIMQGIVTTKGDILGYSTVPARVSVGADGLILKADSAVSVGVSWATVASLLASLLTTKGDLAVSNGTTVVRKAVGTNALTLTADSAQADGTRWGPIITSPAQITSNQNDFAPGVANFLRLDTDAPRDLTGLVAGANGAEVRVIYVGATSITLKHQNAGSAAANRFLNQGAVDIVLAADNMAYLFYDGVTAIWRVAQL